MNGRPAKGPGRTVFELAPLLDSADDSKLMVRSGLILKERGGTGSQPYQLAVTRLQKKKKLAVTLGAQRMELVMHC